MLRESPLRRSISRESLLSDLSVRDEKVTLVNRFFGAFPDEEAIARHISTLESKLDAYEFILSKQQYLAVDVSIDL